MSELAYNSLEERRGTKEARGDDIKSVCSVCESRYCARIVFYGGELHTADVPLECGKDGLDWYGKKMKSKRASLEIYTYLGICKVSHKVSLQSLSVSRVRFN